MSPGPRIHAGLALALLVSANPLAEAASYTIGRARIAGGGSAGTGGHYALVGTTGQTEAAPPRATGRHAVSGGFWANPAATAHVVGNQAAVTGPDSVERRRSVSATAKIPLAVLVGNDADADGDPLIVLSVHDALPSGASVRVSGPWVVYTAPSANSGTGSFRYTVSDGPGGHQSEGTVSITDVDAEPQVPAPNVVSVHRDASGFVATFLGVPGLWYRVQYTTDAAPPYVWRDFQPAAIHQAASQGVLGSITFIDANTTDPIRLYRCIPTPSPTF